MWGCHGDRHQELAALGAGQRLRCIRGRAGKAACLAEADKVLPRLCLLSSRSQGLCVAHLQLAREMKPAQAGVGAGAEEVAGIMPSWQPAPGQGAL